MISESQLLNHIYQTAEMGCSGIRSVLKYADRPQMKDALHSQLKEYRTLQASAKDMLKQRGKKAKGIAKIARISSQSMAAMKTRIDHSETKLAEMMIQGSTMGVTKSLRTMRDCELHDGAVEALADRLLKTEERNIEEMKAFL